MDYIYSDSDTQLSDILTFNNLQFPQSFIDKMLEIT